MRRNNKIHKVTSVVPKWCTFTIERVKKMRSEGKSSKEIAQIMKKSYASIDGLFYQIDHGLVGKEDKWGNIDVKEYKEEQEAAPNPRFHPTLPVINF